MDAHQMYQNPPPAPTQKKDGWSFLMTPTDTYYPKVTPANISYYLFQISKALAGADRKDLMRRLPKFIYDEEKALEVKPLFIYLWETTFCVPKVPIFFSKMSPQDTTTVFELQVTIFWQFAPGFDLTVKIDEQSTRHDLDGQI